MKDVKNTILWKAFKEKANTEQVAVVSKFVEKATNRLILVRDTFPTYTLHNDLHSINLLELMANLVKNDIENINGLELAIFILSAYYHDIGMVFSPEERNQLQNEVYFNDFIETYPGALLKIKKYQSTCEENKNSIPEDVAEWYCRWIHPQRSEDFVKTMEEILWNRFPINDAVALVCKSHGYDISEVYRWDGLEIDFCGNADLLFCSILLRLADILDFDNSRSPEEVYAYLRLSERKTKRESVSDIEWRKHLNSIGFVFPDKMSNERYSIKFIAAPDEPVVEYDIRKFLEIIENEIEKSNSILKFCSSKWQSFKLPLTIDKKDIKSKGYSYGDYRFTLEQEQILDLLMGENLYSDRYAFIRELVQNAIDTTRHRIIYENSIGNIDFEPNPIQISLWTDRDGYTWFRIDDYGIGMNEDIITNFFLKVGSSYYRSEQFQVELLNYKSDFMPISRFGIGILSCFIIGDIIELNTRKATKNSGKNALRMTLKGLNNFYILKKECEKHSTSSMPNEFNTNESYRKPNEFGTSIAVRFNPKKETGNFNLKETLNKYVLCSPVPIKYDGEHVGGNYKDLIENEWIKPINFPIDEEIQRKIEETLKIKFSDKLSISINPLNLSNFSPSKNLRGQAIYGLIQIPEKDELLFKSNIEFRELKIEWNKLSQNIKLIADYVHRKKIRKFNYNGYNIDYQYRLIKKKIEDLSDSEKGFQRGNIHRICRELRNIIELEYYIIEKYSGEKFFFVNSLEELLIQANDIKNKVEKEQEFDLKSIKKIVRELDKSNEARQFGYNFYKSMKALSDRDNSYFIHLWDKFEKDIQELIFEYYKIDNDKIKQLFDEAYEFQRLKLEYQDAKRKFKIGLTELTERIKKLVTQLKYHWISHNGIFVPTNHKEYNFEIENPIRNGFLWCNIELKDALRPDLSLSRDELKGISWQIYSDIGLMIFKSTKHFLNGNMKIFKELIGHQNFLYGQMLEDKNIKLENGWNNEPIITTDKGILSINQIKKGIENGTIYIINNIVGIHRYNTIDPSEKPSFIDICRMAVLQRHLLIQYDTPKDNLITKEMISPVIIEEFNLYPSLFFVEYDTDNILRNKNNPINKKHKFSIWLINNTIILSEKHPSLFENIKENLTIRLGWENKANIETIIKNINEIMQRLRDINFEGNPPKSIFLTEEDFVV
ncbi:MAG: ATP-binding protein [Tannerellaceae bacterium]|jgi:hypothetical protein|nr:ATP-binding protein [Tannerellaceae bacterium]